MSDPSVKSQNNYTSCDVDKAIPKVETGEISQAKPVCYYGILLQTLSRSCKKKIESVKAKRPGLAPMLGKESEDDLVHLALTMQKQGIPVGWEIIIQKAQ